MYASITQGMVFYRVRSKRVHGIFFLLCACVSAHIVSNVIALYLVRDLASYVTTSKLSTVFAIFTVVALTWFVSDCLESNNFPPMVTLH